MKRKNLPDLNMKTEENVYMRGSGYISTLSLKQRKSDGVFYTPREISELLGELLFERLPEGSSLGDKRLIDFSCGCGNLLSGVENTLIDKGIDYNRDTLIFGVDKDGEAIRIAAESLELPETSFDLCDILFDNRYDGKFDYLIGNPPFVGHKSIDKEYRRELEEIYSDVYRDKGDLYYCFIKKGLELLKDGGRYALLVPRFFLESPSGKGVRRLLAGEGNIERIIDMVGTLIFKDASISCCIITGTKRSDLSGTCNKIEASATIIDDDLSASDAVRFFKEGRYPDIRVMIGHDDTDWLLCSEEDKDFIDSMRKGGKYYLKNIAESYQGIITGCDRAYIYPSDDLRIEKISDKVKRPWIKNVNIREFTITDSNLTIIYIGRDSEGIDELDYICEVLLRPHYERLARRRECRLGSRKWHELQWGRRIEDFNDEKLIVPYKSSSNRFAVDREGRLFSADVYGIRLRKEYRGELSHEYLAGILNSDVYNRYFKLIAKKLGRNLYDYYPNKVMELPIIVVDDIERVEELSKRAESANTEEDLEEIRLEINEIIKVYLAR